MKAILEFDLPDDKYNLATAQKGMDYVCGLWDIDQKLRGIVKYGSSDDKETICCNIRDMIQDITDFSEIE